MIRFWTQFVELIFSTSVFQEVIPPSFKIWLVNSIFIECATGSHIAYNNGDSFCFEFMAAAACVDMLANCQNKHGSSSTLLRVPNADVYADIVSLIRWECK